MTDVSLNWGRDEHIHVEASSFFTFGTAEAVKKPQAMHGSVISKLKASMQV